MKYIHGKGLLHLDLKPKNIMFKNSKLKKIVIIDFGVSTVDRQIDTDILGFTAFYCPPEIKEGKSDVSEKSDIFNLGMFCFNLFINIRVLYEFLTRSRAWIKYRI